jgi:hypothetical protein
MSKCKSEGECNYYNQCGPCECAENDSLKLLRWMLADGTFHHATYRDQGTIWEGLYVYQVDDSPMGYTLALSFNKGAESDAAHNLVRHTGVSLGSFR